MQLQASGGVNCCMPYGHRTGETNGAGIYCITKNNVLCGEM